LINGFVKSVGKLEGDFIKMADDFYVLFGKNKSFFYYFNLKKSFQ